ncbi:MAG: isochorismate synthase [Actinobacteria bacterium]|nr:isochorismate synthase [Actinomycetota bacterium]MDA3016468.1 isochorismate synthase [Actinomycetota bacterium]
MRSTTKLLSTVTDQPVDLNDFAGDAGYLFVRDGIGVAGRGVAARVGRKEVESVLQQIDDSNSSGVDGAGPIAIGCIPFISSDAHEFVIPKTVVGKTESGQQWVTQIDDSPFDFVPPAKTKPVAASFSVNHGVTIEHYLEAVRLTAAAVGENRLAKAVIARDIFVTTDKSFDIAAIMQRLRASFGSSYRYLVDGFIGASPELLIAVSGNQVSSHPLAGTAPRTGNAITDQKIAETLIASTKNQLEHRIVIDMVHETLLPWCSYLDWQAEPSIVAVANVQHLGTEISGQLSEPRPSVLELAYALSPTPALGGAPRDAALAQIALVEGMSRGRYGGAVGYFNKYGDGRFAVSIRCAEFDQARTTARLFAGGGIVADSEPESELAETQAKFQAMLAALIRP